MSVRAAEQGYAPAECSLGVLYLKGLGVPKDRQEGLKWLFKASYHGEKVANQNLLAMGIQP